MCGRRETFNLHDFRYGLPLGAPGERVLRGQRIRCCPRRKSNPGCGAFVTILFADVLPRLSFTASLLGKLLARLCLGDSINKAWKAAGRVLSVDGAYCHHSKGMVQSKLIAFVDDASRLCVHGAFFPAENVDSLVDALSAGFYKRGIPQSLYVDNGSIYTSKEIVQICARVGCVLLHTPVKDGASKGKVERFFRRVRDQFLCREQDTSSIEALNRAFNQWVEETYNATEHSVIGMSPLNRFALDRSRVRYLPPNEVNEELFFVEDDRVVKADNTFAFKGKRHEAPRHLPNRTIQVRFSRSNPTAKVAVYYKGERCGLARVVDYIANDRKKQKEISL